MKPEVTLYTRAGCCLCDEAKQVIAAARLQADFDYTEIDIDMAAGGRKSAVLARIGRKLVEGEADRLRGGGVHL